MKMLLWNVVRTRSVLSTLRSTAVTLRSTFSSSSSSVATASAVSSVMTAPQPVHDTPDAMPTFIFTDSGSIPAQTPEPHEVKPGRPLPRLPDLRSLPIGQPTHRTHPHLIAENEITRGNARVEYVHRRERVFQQMWPNSMLILAASPERFVTTDVPYFFRQETNFRFLTGLEDPDCVVILEKDAEMNCIYRLFLPDMDQKRIWTRGPYTIPQNASAAFGCDEALPVSQLGAFLKSRPSLVVYHHEGIHPTVDQQVKASMSKFQMRELKDSFPLVQAAYRIKSAADIEMLTQTADISEAMFRSVMQCTRPGLSELHLEAILGFEARIRGANRLAYPPIVAGGKNGLAVHYLKNNQLLRDGELVMVDAGAEYHGYTSDVTRTWPVNGRFSDAQKLIYSAVLDVQIQIIEAHKECGRKILSLQHLTQQLLAQRLMDFGILKKANFVDHLLSGALNRFYGHMHGHPMGFDIHEPDLDGLHQPGMVVTVEPGLYIPDAEDIPKEFRGICVRIEDNILLTDSEPIVLTRNIPKTFEEIEQLMEKSRSEEQKISPLAKHVMTHHRI